MGIIGTLFRAVALWIIVIIVAIIVICRYLAKRIAAEFKYDYLAQRIAEEICKRMMIIENQKKAAYKDATGAAEDQSRGARTGAPEQDESRQE